MHSTPLNTIHKPLTQASNAIDHGKHYRYSYKGIKIDPYRIFRLYKITDPAQQHAIKKLLRAGQSVKPLEQDIDEVIMTLERWKEMNQEDGETLHGEAGRHA